LTIKICFELKKYIGVNIFLLVEKLGGCWKVSIRVTRVLFLLLVESGLPKFFQFLSTDEGNCRGLIPRVPQVTGYGTKNLNTVWFPPVANDWGTKYHVLDMFPPLLAEDGGPPT
jgi:hypothetical protein